PCIYHLSLHGALPISSKLKIVLSGVQACSSSPINLRSGSAESVVFPVPERPKKIAVSPSSPILAEQCIGKVFLSTGIIKLSAEKDRKSTRLNSSHVKI